MLLFIRIFYHSYRNETEPAPKRRESDTVTSPMTASLEKTTNLSSSQVSHGHPWDRQWSYILSQRTEKILRDRSNTVGQEEPLWPLSMTVAHLNLCSHCGWSSVSAAETRPHTAPYPPVKSAAVCLFGSLWHLFVKEVRRQLEATGSILPLCGTQVQTQAVNPAANYRYTLTHLTSLILIYNYIHYRAVKWHTVIKNKKINK